MTAKKAPLVLVRENGTPSIVVRVGQLWAIGKGDRKRRIYSVVDTRRIPEREVRLWDGFGSPERAEWVPLAALANYTQVGKQGNLTEGR